MDIFSKEILYARGVREFVRPNLTANGNMNGNTFAVTATYGNGVDDTAYRAVDASPSTYCTCSGNDMHYDIYNPEPLKITQLVFTAVNAQYLPSQIIIYGSNKYNQNWVSIGSYNRASSSSTTITAILSNNTNYYKYYKFQLVPYSNAGVAFKDIQISGELQ